MAAWHHSVLSFTPSRSSSSWHTEGRVAILINTAQHLHQANCLLQSYKQVRVCLGTIQVRFHSSLVRQLTIDLNNQNLI